MLDVRFLKSYVWHQSQDTKQPLKTEARLMNAYIFLPVRLESSTLSLGSIRKIDS